MRRQSSRIHLKMMAVLGLAVDYSHNLLQKNPKFWGGVGVNYRVCYIMTIETAPG